ncbi:MAG: TlpA disulfide reductase family protein [Ferruginibacter sp.]
MKTGFILLSILLLSVAVSAQQGWWTALLHRADGNNIVFSFEWKKEKGKDVWYIRNAEERIRVSQIVKQKDSLVIHMPTFESQFRVKSHGKKLEGVWVKGGARKTQLLPFTATAGDRRFAAPAVTNKNITGRWATVFAENKPDELAVGEFKQNGNKLRGTFLNPSGDYRYLEGVVSGDSLFLSAFDGSHAFLFTAKIDNDSSITGGTYFSGATYKESWTAVKDSNAKISEQSVAMYKRPGEEYLNFSFKSLDGKTVSIKDERFKNKVVVVQLMGSWCPNCMDETAFLNDYYRKNKQKGFEVIALAYEYSTDWNRSVKSLSKVRERFNVQYPMLITGVAVTDSLRTEKTLPELTPIKFFPSSVVLDKKGRIRKLDTGFNGPATGEHYELYKKEFEETVDSLLAED